MFKINTAVYSAMFSLPQSVADKGLKLVSGEQLKVIIAIFRNPDADVKALAEKTGLPEYAVKEAVEYWIGEGVLCADSASENPPAPPATAEKKEVRPLPEIRFVNPTQQEIGEILESNSAMRRLFNEAQEILGKTVGYTMQCSIYSVVNFYGITPDVANCLLHFARSISCTSQSDIQKIAAYWSQNGITSLTAADDYIAETEKAVEFYRQLAKLTGNSEETPSFAILEMVAEWIRWGYSPEAVFKAYEIMKEEKQTGRLNWNAFRHINGTVKNWRARGAVTVEDIERGTEKFASKGKKAQKETSFNVELAEKNARENPKDFGSMKNRKKRKES